MITLLRKGQQKEKETWQVPRRSPLCGQAFSARTHMWEHTRYTFTVQRSQVSARSPSGATLIMWSAHSSPLSLRLPVLSHIALAWVTSRYEHKHWTIIHVLCSVFTYCSRAIPRESQGALMSSGSGIRRRTNKSEHKQQVSVVRRLYVHFWLRLDNKRSESCSPTWKEWHDKWQSIIKRPDKIIFFSEINDWNCVNRANY